MRRIVALGPAFVVLAVMAAVTFLGPAAVRQMVFTRSQAEVVLARQVLQDDDILERIDRATRRVAEAVKPCVVHIEVTIGAGEGQLGFGPGASGSGWVYDDQGHIVTNAHVIGAAESAQVEFANGRTATARLVEADEFTDIAVLRVDPGIGVIPVARDSSRRVAVGDRVFAFGSPFNFKFSMSEGIVSGLGRDPRTRSSGGSFTNYIQTDAAVNPGNSGGPLVNVYGELIGMNVAIATGSRQTSSNQGQSAGISFAIPLGVIESVADQIIEYGEVRRGYLGIRSAVGWDQSTDVLDRHGDFVGRGILVASVEDGLAADQAGIEPGDIITRIDDTEIREWHHLSSVISTASPGSTIEVELWRDGEPIKAEVQLARFPDGTLHRREVRPALFRAGLQIVEITGEDGEPSVRVDRLTTKGDAAVAGFQVGDRITSVNGETVTDELSFYAAMGRANAMRGKPVRFGIEREDERDTVTLRLD